MKHLYFLHQLRYKYIPRARLRLAELIGGKWFKDLVEMGKRHLRECIDLRQAMDELDKEYDGLFEEWNNERKALLKRISELEKLKGG